MRKPIRDKHQKGVYWFNGLYIKRSECKKFWEIYINPWKYKMRKFKGGTDLK